MNERRSTERRVSPAIGEWALQERPKLLARIAELEAKIAGYLAFKVSVDEALNSGDGSYKP